jgi:hypothetical protein
MVVSIVMHAMFSAFWCACMGRRFLFSISRSIIHKLRALDYDGRFSGVFRQSEHDLIISYCNFRLQVLVLLTYSMRRVLPQVLVCERDALLFGTEAHVGNKTTSDSLSPGMIMTFLLPLKMTESPNHRGSRSPLMQARRKLNMEKKETGGSSPTNDESTSLGLSDMSWLAR